MSDPSGGSRRLQITEEDFAELERTIPQLVDSLMVKLDNRARTQLRRVKQILSDVRWNYGPHLDVEVIPADGQPPSTGA